MSKKQKTNYENIYPMQIDGMNGRMVNYPARTKDRQSNDIIFVYGHHSSLERWWGLVQALSNHGNVIVPDLPGFGGMDSLYKIGKKPTVDNLADYMAEFINRYYKDKKIVLAGLSFGFVVITRMLQRHPEMVANVKLLVSIVGFSNRDEFTFSKKRFYFYYYLSKVFTHRPFSWFFRYAILNSFVLRMAYSRTHNAKNKFKNASNKEEFNELMDVEIGLWQDNEVRTYLFTTCELLTLQHPDIRVDLPVLHVSAKADHFFDNTLVEKNMRKIFTDFKSILTPMTNHAPSVIADEKAAESFIPEELHLLLNKI